ncbi:hypothetical protein PILCRDRAFT_11461 [Piloderma croceum F 1598]|uniref:Uncharacterized protein n=1 Tax=Piloderma croceum (strain F 1598) TaxID=765440 RepID=A0A0C3FE85_PILCF|nr:hypothetical protein PILCRDRAFT_11461 [Piloderma croceum F 1598]
MSLSNPFFNLQLPVPAIEGTTMQPLVTMHPSTPLPGNLTDIDLTSTHDNPSSPLTLVPADPSPSLDVKNLYSSFEIEQLWNCIFQNNLTEDNSTKTRSTPQTLTTTIPHISQCLVIPLPPTTFEMNNFDSYLLLPSILDSADDADDLQFLFQCPQTPLLTEPTYTNLTPSHLESALPMVLSGSPTDSINPMLMFYASEGVAKVWDNFWQTNVKGRNGSFHAKDYYIVHAVSPYFMLDPIEPGAWFITWPGTGGKDNPSGMSGLITGTPLHLEDISVCAFTCALEFHVYHCILGLAFLHQGGYTFYYTNPHVFTRETIPHAEDPISIIVAIPDYHTTEMSRYLTIQPDTFNQEMVPGYSNLARPPCRIWEYGEEEEKKQEKFDWFMSSEDDIREEVASILKAREFGSG